MNKRYPNYKQPLTNFLPPCYPIQVVSTLTHFDSEIISQTVRAQSCRVPTPLPDDPYVAVRQAHLADTDTESRPVEDIRETEVPQPLLILPSLVPSSDDLHLTVGQAHTPATVDTESEPEEASSKTKEFEAYEPSDTGITSSHSSASSDSTTPLSPNHPLTQTSPTPTPTRVLSYRRTTRMAVHTQPTLSPGMSARIAEAAALSPSSFRKRYRSPYEIPSPPSSPTLPIRKRYRVLAEDTVVDEPLGLSYGALRRRELVVREGEMPSMFEVGQSSRFVPEHEGAERVSAFRYPTLVTWADPKDGRVYTDIPTYVPPVAPVQTPPSLERSSGSLPVSPSSPAVPTPVASLRLDTLPHALFEGYDRDLRELYTRPVLALKAWAGQTDAQRAALWHVVYDIQRENYDLKM
ncbi:hypothetical protein Tco_0623162 [Tanacetum coccineum]